MRLGTGELAAAAVFAVVSLGAPDIVWAGVAPLVVVLAQAGGYWLLARRWVPGGRMPKSVAMLYRVFRLANPLLLAATAIALLTNAVAAVAFVVAVGAWTFAAVEHVNYYVVRLAYPPARWWTTVRRWRTPRLVRDLQHATRT